MIRILDILIALSLLILLSPLFLIISLLLKITGEREIFYIQTRIGSGQRPFALIKFATMKKNSLHMGTKSITLKNDFRVLPFGGVLRKTKLNELPQLLNILIGQMSFVGPRPMTEEIFSLYSEEGQKELASVKPGLTGIGSIVFRNEENLLSISGDPQKFYAQHIIKYKERLELWAIRNSGIKNYLKIFLITIYIVLVPIASLRTLWKIFPNLPYPTGDLNYLLKLKVY